MPARLSDMTATTNTIENKPYIDLIDEPNSNKSNAVLTAAPKDRPNSDKGHDTTATTDTAEMDSNNGNDTPADKTDGDEANDPFLATLDGEGNDTFFA